MNSSLDFFTFAPSHETRARATIDSLTHPRSAPVEIPSGPRVPPPGAGASPCVDLLRRDTLGGPLAHHRCVSQHVGVKSVASLVTPQPVRYPPLVLFTGRSRPSGKQAVEAADAGRHRTEAEPVEQAPDHELESYLAALSPEGDPESTGSGRRFGGSQVYQLRLSLMANEQLREIAAHNQTSPLALAQEWVMQRLEWEAQQLPRR